MKHTKTRTILGIVGVLTILQVALFCIKRLIFVFVARTDFSDHVSTMVAMTILTTLVVVFARKQKIPLSVFPQRFGGFYIAGTCIYAILLISTPSNYIEGFPAMVLLFYSSVVTPIYEELVFRGYVWNKLNAVFKKEWMTYIAATILFAVWHIGYIDSIAFRVDAGLAEAMLWKVLVGLRYGLILGALRWKAKTSYSTMLLHGVMNIFGR